MTTWDGITTVEDLRSLAPEAFAALDRVRRCALGAGIDQRVASPAVARYADQLTMDVASLTAEQRATAAAVLGDDLFGFVQATWALDMADRIDHAWRQLTSAERTAAGAHADDETEIPSADAAELWAAIDTFLPAVARLSALDPVTTEVIRLRGARAHDCRLCRSLRSVGAIEAGADEGTFDAIDRYETTDLDQRLKAALRLTDAVIWEPRAWPEGLAAHVRSSFTPAEAVEIVLDVVRNAANKIAVALEVDQAHVTDGVEYFSMDDSGGLTYGLEHPAAPT